MGLLRIDTRKLEILSSANGINSSHKITIGMPPKNGEKDSASSAPAITAVHTTKDHLALAKPKASAPITSNQTIRVIEKSSEIWGIPLKIILLRILYCNRPS